MGPAIGLGRLARAALPGGGQRQMIGAQADALGPEKIARRRDREALADPARTIGGHAAEPLVEPGEARRGLGQRAGHPGLGADPGGGVEPVRPPPGQRQRRGEGITGGIGI